jgi:hypothetical protein
MSIKIKSRESDRYRRQRNAALDAINNAKRGGATDHRLPMRFLELARQGLAELRSLGKSGRLLSRIEMAPNDEATPRRTTRTRWQWARLASQARARGMERAYRVCRDYAAQCARDERARRAA